MFVLLAQEVAPITSAAAGAVGLTDPLDWRHVVGAILGCLALLLPLALDYAKRKGWVKDGSAFAKAVAIYQRAKTRHDKEGGSWSATLFSEMAEHPAEVQAMVISMLPFAHVPGAS